MRLDGRNILPNLCKGGLTLKSIGSKLLVIVIPILIVALVAVAWINHSKAKEFLEHNYREKSMLALDLLQTKVNDWLQQHAENIAGMAQISDLNGMDSEKQRSFLQKQISEHSEYEMFLVAKPDGEAWTTTNQRVNIADRPYFREAMAGKPYVISQPLISKVSGKMVVVIASPLRNQADQAVGVLGATIPLDRLSKLVGEVKIGQTGYAYMTQQDGLVISHPNPEHLLKLNITRLGSDLLTQAHQEALKGQTGEVRYVFEGTEKYAFYTQVPVTGWVLYLTSPVAEATAQLSYLAKLSCGTAAVGLGFGLIVLVKFTPRLVPPLQTRSKQES